MGAFKVLKRIPRGLFGTPRVCGSYTHTPGGGVGDAPMPDRCPDNALGSWRVCAVLPAREGVLTTATQSAALASTDVLHLRWGCRRRLFELEFNGNDFERQRL